MSNLIVRYRADGSIRGWRYIPDEEYVPGENEIIAPDHIDHRDINRGLYIVDEGELIEDPDYDPLWNQPTMLDPETFDLITDLYLHHGGEMIGSLEEALQFGPEAIDARDDARDARDVLVENSNIPQEVNDFANSVIEFMNQLLFWGGEVNATMENNIRLHYLIYVSLIGDRIEEIEEAYF